MQVNVINTEIVMTAMHRHGSKKVFTSDHPVDRGTSVTLVGKDCILLEDSGAVAVQLLDYAQGGALCAVLKARLTYQIIEDALEELLFPLMVDYGDRGDPYISGVTLSLSGVSVFLGKHEVRRLVKALS